MVTKDFSKCKVEDVGTSVVVSYWPAAQLEMAGGSDMDHHTLAGGETHLIVGAND